MLGNVTILPTPSMSSNATVMRSVFVRIWVALGCCLSGCGLVVFAEVDASDSRIHLSLTRDAANASGAIVALFTRS